VAHLLLARAVTRGREVAIRTALGASRGRIVRQMMTETMVLSVAGCVLGAVIGAVALRTMVRFRPPTLAELQLAHVDMTALAVVVATSLLCALAFGAVSAAATSSRTSTGLLRSGVVAMFSRGGERFRSALVVTEMALSAMLLVGAALLVRTVMELQRTDLGFDPANLHVVAAEMPESRYPTPQSRLTAFRALAAAVQAIPGVRAVTVSDALPSYRNFSLGTLHIEGQPMPTGKTTSFIDVGSIGPSYFRTLGASLIEGRVADSSSSVREIVVNESFARKHWQPGQAVGRRMRIVYEGEQNEWMTIVGVVRDVMTMGPVGEKGAPFLYMSQIDATNPGLIYRTDGNPATLAQVTAAAKTHLPDARIRQHATATIIGNTLAPSRFIMMLMTGFSILAVVLAAIGLYGMMAYAVAQRTREIGIRMALGATRENIARSVVGRGAALGLVGAGFGLLLAAWGTKAIEGSLYGVSRLDVSSFVFGGLGLVAIAVAASLMPMRRAVAVDPMTAIRAD
jgi:putative ABC transport system permease protein